MGSGRKEVFWEGLATALLPLTVVNLTAAEPWSISLFVRESSASKDCLTAAMYV